MTVVAGYLLLFLFVSSTFLLFHLLMGKMIRPSKPDADKLTIYECGEPAIGSAWIQFDLRFYVVALLFVIFDVEVVFFFPWALVFGKANQLAMQQTPVEARNKVAETLLLPPQVNAWAGVTPAEVASGAYFDKIKKKQETTVMVAPETAWQLALIAFFDILVFFGVLLLGFAYLWKRGDLDWVRSTLAEHPTPQPSGAEHHAVVSVNS
jgi:NADH-quinone oxidoreductase subunit A